MRNERLERNRDYMIKVIDYVDCPYCFQKTGTLCKVTNYKKNHGQSLAYSQTHKARIKRYNMLHNPEPAEEGDM